MKRLIALLSLLGIAVLPAQTTVPDAAPATKSEVKAAPGNKDDAKKKEEEGKISGQTIARSTTGYLGLEIAQGSFKLSFYDAKKKPIAADVTWAIARWLVKYNKSGDERTTLNLSGDGKSLVGVRTIPPPYTFKLYLSLFKDTSPDAQVVENYIIDFSG
ncbi:MAG: hypothetical protein ACHQ5A_01570 [Opitutales bacterium]